MRLQLAGNGSSRALLIQDRAVGTDLDGGFADVAGAALTILAEDARPASEFGRSEIEAKVAQAQQALAAAEAEASSAAERWEEARTHLGAERECLVVLERALVVQEDVGRPIT